MGSERVLHGEIVQTELGLHLAKDRGVGLEEANPDKPVALRERLADIL